MPRRGRKLTPSEKTLWAKVVEKVDPVRELAPEDTRPGPDPGPPAGPPEAPDQVRGAVTTPRPIPKPQPKRNLTPQPTFTDLPTDTSPAMDRRNFQRLVRGRMEIDATLDLHGMSADQARVRLTGFVTQGHAAGFRLLLIITGKGRTDGGRVDEFNRPRRAVIRESLPGWLSGPSLSQKVLQVTQAHPKHGGAGAFYVYLRRRR